MSRHRKGYDTRSLSTIPLNYIQLNVHTVFYLLNTLIKQKFMAVCVEISQFMLKFAKETLYRIHIYFICRI